MTSTKSAEPRVYIVESWLDRTESIDHAIESVHSTEELAKKGLERALRTVYGPDAPIVVTPWTVEDLEAQHRLEHFPATSRVSADGLFACNRFDTFKVNEWPVDEEDEDQ
ncbi:hypothetical protein [Microbispora sp. NPDC049633]|uniref:hypothetical protein n=1 Tax=Microbispora sp. NPDC049633 TaxID=3154355 RepID=UPI003435D10F